MNLYANCYKLHGKHVNFKKNLHFSLILLLTVVFCWRSVILPAETGRTLYVTWEGFEVDKCASIWLIKRFIDKNAEFRFLPQDEIVREGIPFDIPEAEFRRYHNMSTYESLIKHYGLKDGRLVHIGRIIHDIEVNIWERKACPETPEVQDSINQIILTAKDSDEIMARSITFFDSFYGRLP